MDGCRWARWRNDLILSITPAIPAPGVATPADVLLLGNVPHDWLFPRCSAVIHHGGAGTTAAGAGLAMAGFDRVSALQV